MPSSSSNPYSEIDSPPARRVLARDRPTEAFPIMPPPIRVEIVPYSSSWQELAQLEIQQLTHVVGPFLCDVHHIGSTAVPGLAAKSILDLMPVTSDIEFIDCAMPAFERLGYCSWGELGISGRRYFTRDSKTGNRVVQLHCFQQGSAHIERHLAFRDYLRAHPATRSAYEQEKRRCANRFPADSHAYSDCKADWIVRVENEALKCYRSTGSAIE